MTFAVDDERTATLRKHLLSKIEVAEESRCTSHFFKSSAVCTVLQSIGGSPRSTRSCFCFGRESLHVPNRAEELFINRSFPDEVCDRRVLPYLPQCGVGHSLAADECIHDILKA